ncbi:MAG: RNA polymerase sigma factor [Planctomycetota bacterium]|jgi:RNA polymerase sigma-70 factor (ECF subfamily)
MSSDEQLILQLLILRCQIGDAGALAELIARYERPLRYFISRLLGDLEMTEDIFQETWVSVFGRIGTLKNGEAFGAWLYRIARNKVYHQLRRKKRLTELNESIPVPNGAEEPAFRADDAARIHKCLAVIRTQHREVLMLRFLEQMSYQQISEVLKCNLGTVKSRIYYAKLALKEEMEK